MRSLLALLLVCALLSGCDSSKTTTVELEGKIASLERQNREYCAEVNTLRQLIEYVYAGTEPKQEELEKENSQLAIDLSEPVSQVKPGGTAKLKVKTQPGAICFIALCYKSGLSGATGLTEHSPQEVDQNGECSWQWRVGTKTELGEWPIVVTAYLDGKICTLKTSIKVERP